MRVEDIPSVVDLMALPLTDFVHASYLILLGRAPDPLELKERSGALRRGLGRGRFLGDMSLSAEFRKCQARWLHDGDDKTFIGNVFLRYLDRWADTEALTYYTGICGRHGRARVVSDIFRSQEARMRSTFWYELDHLLADYRADRHLFLRWIGRTKRRERQCNRANEASARRIVSPTSYFHETFALPRARVTSTFTETHDMGRHALQVLARIRHVAGAN